MTRLNHADDYTTLVITTLAEYQTEFWAPVAAALRASGVDVVVCAFDERSADMLEARDIPTARMFDYQATEDEAIFAARLVAYDITNVNLLFSHERVTFKIRDTNVLRRKFMRASNAIEAVFDRLLAAGRRPLLVQELGGFLSVLAAFYAARLRGIDNWFIEPSFFRGRLLFLRNTLNAFSIPGPSIGRVSPAVESYLKETVAQKAIVIPKKDRHQYSTLIGKITNRRNIRRLMEKLRDKYFLGKHQEFGYIGVHVFSHLRMTWNSFRMRGLYTPLENAGRFVYYPLHVPADMALTLRSPEYFDQLSLVDYLLRIVPRGFGVAIKEHPAQVGAMPIERIRALARRYDNLVVLPPSTNNYAVLERASAVVSVNSKAGGEALLVGRNVLVLGDAFYSGWNVVSRVNALRDIAPVIESILDRPGPDRVLVYEHFQALHENSFPGELYVADPDNVVTFVQSLQTAVIQNRVLDRIASQ